MVLHFPSTKLSKHEFDLYLCPHVKTERFQAFNCKTKFQKQMKMIMYSNVLKPNTISTLLSLHFITFYKNPFQLTSALAMSTLPGCQDLYPNICACHHYGFYVLQKED